MGKPGRPKGSRNKIVRPLRAIHVPRAYFKISLSIGDTVYHGKGMTVAEALRDLKRPPKIVSKGRLVLVGHGKRFERNFMPLQLKRFLYPMANNVQAKQIEVAMK